MPQKRLLQLLIGCEQRGGLVSHRMLSSGDEVPYEINISWWSAMADGGIDPTYLQRERFLLTQLMIMALPGVPAFYLPALLAAMTLIAAMVSLKFVRFGQSLTVILGGILAGFVLYVVSELIQAFANAGTIPPVVAAWLPVLVAAALGTTVLLHKEDG